MLESCKLTGTRYDDVERWINSKLNRASMREIYEYTGILKERGKFEFHWRFINSKKYKLLNFFRRIRFLLIILKKFKYPKIHQTKIYKHLNIFFYGNNIFFLIR